MPSERLQKKTTIAEGGLVETLDVLSLTKFPGRLAISNNYEVGLSGGYRRIDGYVKYSTTEVSGTGAILGAAVFNSGVVVAREHASSGNTEVFFGTGSSWGSKINSDTRTAQGKHRFWRYNWNGTESIIGCDGGQYAFKYDGSTYTVLNGTGSPANPKFVTEFKDHMFFAGYSANSSGIIFSAPADETKFLTIDGGGEIMVGDEIMNIQVFRDRQISRGLIEQRKDRARRSRQRRRRRITIEQGRAEQRRAAIAGAMGRPQGRRLKQKFGRCHQPGAETSV